MCVRASVCVCVCEIVSECACVRLSVSVYSFVCVCVYIFFLVCACVCFLWCLDGRLTGPRPNHLKTNGAVWTLDIWGSPTNPTVRSLNN